MTKQFEIYKCEVCGNIVEVSHAGAGQLVCCGQPMELLIEKTEDAGLEKHVPIVEQTDTGILVKVGSVLHPMEQEHFIEWIEVIVNGEVYKKFLNPGDAPEASFEITQGNIFVRAYCNLHGLWKAG
ncbi:MAG: desulfoferrodoxin [Candidatus Altiarchaeota archaeon]|nr:desulfoferrodoxin [Candidatus Altiarchaeota archaeon]